MFYLPWFTFPGTEADHRHVRARIKLDRSWESRHG